VGIVFSLSLILLLIYQRNNPVSTDTEITIIAEEKNNLPENNYFTIVVLGDTPLSIENYEKLQNILPKINPRILIHLGDHTDCGELEKINTAKNLLDDLGFDYVAIPGDRDLGVSNGSKNFYSVFPKVTKSRIENTNLVFIDNSANFTPLSNNDLEEYLSLLASTDILFLPQPILTKKGGMFSEKYMGSSEDIDFIKNHEERIKLYNQQKELILNEVRKSKIKYVISSDHHISTTFTDYIRNDITFHQVGALANTIQFGDLEISQNSLQTNRFTLLKVYENGNINHEEIILD